MKVNYKNRYGDVFTFTKDETGNVLWEGDFSYCRIGVPNNYTVAYEAYCVDCGKSSIDPISLEEFKEKVHEWDDAGHTYTEFSKKWGELVYSEVDKIEMVDPSGGPYVCVGMPSESVYPSIKGKKIIEIKNSATGYQLILG